MSSEAALQMISYWQAATDPKRTLRIVSNSKVNTGLRNTVTLRNTISAFEIVLGVVLLSQGAFWISRSSQCPADALDCEGWAILTAVIFVYPGLAFLVAGICSTYVKRLSLLWIQTILGAFLLVFFALFTFF